MDQLISSSLYPLSFGSIIYPTPWDEVIKIEMASFAQQNTYYPISDRVKVFSQASVELWKGFNKVNEGGGELTAG